MSHWSECVWLSSKDQRRPTTFAEAELLRSRQLMLGENARVTDEEAAAFEAAAKEAGLEIFNWGE